LLLEWAEKRADLEQGEQSVTAYETLLKQKRVLICTFVALASGFSVLMLVGK